MCTQKLVKTFYFPLKMIASSVQSKEFSFGHENKDRNFPCKISKDIPFGGHENDI